MALTVFKKYPDNSGGIPRCHGIPLASPSHPPPIPLPTPISHSPLHRLHPQAPGAHTQTTTGEDFYHSTIPLSHPRFPPFLLTHCISFLSHPISSLHLIHQSSPHPHAIPLPPHICNNLPVNSNLSPETPRPAPPASHPYNTA